MSFFVIIFGYLSYQAKLDDLARGSQQEPTNTQTASEEAAAPSEPDDEVPGLLGQVLKNTEADSISITFFGSEAMELSSDGTNTWPMLLLDQMNEQVAPIDIQSEILSVGKLTSTDALTSDTFETLLDVNADIIFFESLTLNDNGLITIDDSEDNLTVMLDQLSEASPDAEIILLPSNPLHNPVQYQRQIDSLHEFGEDTTVFYANHWDTWPDVTSEEINKYTESGTPTDLGHELLASYLLSYISED